MAAQALSSAISFPCLIFYSFSKTLPSSANHAVALKDDMNEDEYQAHQSVVAAAREKQLQQYRALVLAGQQRQLQELRDATGRSSSSGGGDGRSCSGSGGAAAAKGAGDQRGGVDAAMLTMQQLVALLVEQDVAVANDGIM